MKDFVYLGNCPADEDPAQSIEPDYEVKARIEVARYKRLVMSKFKDIPAEVSFKIRKEQHDFAPLYELVAEFDDDDEEACDFAFALEAHLPTRWEE